MAAHPDDTIASTTFNFWHKLSRALTSKPQGGNSPSGSAGSAAGISEKERRLALFRPLFQMLVSLVTGRVRYGPWDCQTQFAIVSRLTFRVLVLVLRLLWAENDMSSGRLERV